MKLRGSAGADDRDVDGWVADGPRHRELWERDAALAGEGVEPGDHVEVAAECVR